MAGRLADATESPICVRCAGSAELRARGYRGSYATISGYVQPFREAGAAPPAVPGPPKARALASWILKDPDSLDDDEKTGLAQARERCPHLDTPAGHVTEFAKILTGLHGDRLDDWIAAAGADDQPGLHSFARGLRRDHDAVLNGLTLPWSSEAVEGNVNRLNMLKRQMYGRATFSLLRKRVLSTLNGAPAEARAPGTVEPSPGSARVHIPSVPRVHISVS